MSGIRFSRLPILSMLALAAVIVFAALASSGTRPQVASAQNIYCGQYGIQNQICPTNPVGLQCNQVATDVNGNSVCTSLATTSCPNGITVNLGYPCPNNGCTGYGNCYNNPYGTTASLGFGVCGLMLTYGPCPPAAGGAAPGQVNCGNGRYAPSAAACAPSTAAVSPATAYTPPVTSTSSTTTAALGTVPGPSNGVSVTFAAGWNLVSAPDGTVLNGISGSLATFQAGDTSYETQPSTTPLKGGRGYWAYFTSSSTQMLPLTTSGTVTVTLPAGTQVLIGNPSSSPATVSGATSLSAFDPSTNQYVAATTLKPGQGAWAVSSAGGPVTISSAG